MDKELFKELAGLPASIKTALSLSALGIIGMLALLGYLIAQDRADLLEKSSFTMLVGLAFTGIIAISAVSLWLERKRGIEKEREKSEDNSLKNIFENILSNDEDCYFIYSKTPVGKYIDQYGEEIEYPFLDKEKHVTTLMDVRGIAYIHSLLYLGGKIEKLEQINCEEFRDDYYSSNLISIGSKNSNTITPKILTGYDAAFLFDEEAMKIICKKTGDSWPDKKETLEKKDYGLLIKLKNIAYKKTYFVIAGIGPTGTLACCYYLYLNFRKISDTFSDTPFSYVLEIDRDLGFTKYKVVKSLPEVS